MDAIQDRVNQVRLESERLIQYLRTFLKKHGDSKALAMVGQSLDVTAHLTGGAKFYTSIILRGLEGYTAPPDGFPFPFGAAPDVMSAANAELTVSFRKELGDGLLAAFPINQRTNESNPSRSQH